MPRLLQALALALVVSLTACAAGGAGGGPDLPASGTLDVPAPPPDVPVDRKPDAVIVDVAWERRASDDRIGPPEDMSFFPDGSPTDRPTVDRRLPDVDNLSCQQDSDCDDGVGCTVDTCNPSTGECSHTPDDSRCDDGSFCNGVERCEITGCVAGTAPCPSGGGPCGQQCNEALRSCQPISNVPNDTCATALDISAGGTFVGDTRCATADAPSACGNGPDVFFRFRLTGTEIVYLDTFGSSFNTVLSVHQGTCDGPQLGCLDDACGTLQSQGAGKLTAGDYIVRLSGVNGASGAYQLNFRRSSCGQAFALPAVANFLSNTCAANGNSLNPAGTCSPASGSPEDVFFFLTCPGDVFAADTCSANTTYDTVLYVRADDCRAPDVTCSDDGVCGLLSNVAASFGRAGLAFLIVDGFGGQCGQYDLLYGFQ